MNTINNIKLTPRLLAAFGVLMLLTAVLGWAGLSALRDLNQDAQSLAEDKMVGLEKAVRLADIASRHRLQTFKLIVPSAAAAKEKARTRQVELEAQFDETWATYAATTVEPGEEAARTAVLEAWSAFKTQAKEVDEIVQAEFLEEATDMAIGDGDVAYEKVTTALDALAAINVQAAEAAVQAAQGTYATARNTILSVLVVSLVLSVLFGWMVGRSVVDGVNGALKAVNDIANGKLDGRIDVSRKDEIGELNQGMAKMQSTLQKFANAETEMAKQHELGEIDHQIDAAAFPGAYGQMADAVNNIAHGLNRDMQAGIEIMQAYASGDLRRDMARLPGKKAQLTETLDAVKANLASINEDIKRLASSAAAGDFSVRGDEARYQHAFREMVEGLNQLMQQADAGLGEVGRLLSALSQGDLTVRVDNRFKGAFFTLVDNANTTVERLTGIARKIMESSEEINVAAGEIASGNADLSTRTEQQAASLEETASSMEELTSTVKQNAENSRQARQLAVGAADVAARGGEVVGKVVTTMDAISASSKRIEDIISVIDGIAFQTNILALNAAVEAARAGEQGRGFAVVASEVRSLAQRSADAAKEIKQLIAESVITVTEGSTLVHNAGKTMDEIMSSVRRVTDIMSEIAAASDEQSSGIEQVNQTIVQMDETTQQNAALVEQASAAARSMEEQAGLLSQAVSVFKLAGVASVRKPASARKESIEGPGLLPSRGGGKPPVAAPKASAPTPPRAVAAKPEAAAGKTANATRSTAVPKPAAATKPTAAKPLPPAPKPAGKTDEHHWEEF